MEIQEQKIGMPTKRQFLILIPFAFFYAAFIVLADWRKAADSSVVASLGRVLLWTLVSYIVLLVLCYAIAYGKSGAGRIPILRRLKEQHGRKGRWYVYVVFFLICFLCYLPYFLMYFPAWLSNDAVWQLEQALGWVEASNHHPYFHTMIIKLFFSIGYQLFGTISGGVAFYTFWQVVIMAMVFAFYLYQLYRRGTRLPWLIMAVGFYAFLPINGILSICMGKDEFFVASLLFFAWIGSEFDLERERTEGEADTDKKIFRNKTVFVRLAYFTAGLLVCLLRSNGIFIFLGTAVVLVSAAHIKRERKFPKNTFFCVAAVLICYLIYHGLLLNMLHVEPPDTIESLTMPTQHILSVYMHDGKLTEGEVELIDAVAPVEQLGDYYNPHLFDPVKGYIRESGNQQAIEENKGEYFKLWLRAGLRNPLLYIVAEVQQTSGYWAYRAEHYQFLYSEYFMVDNPFGLTTERKLFSYDAGLAMNDYLIKFQDLFNRVWSLGLDTWLMLFCLAYMAYRGRRAMLFIPYIMLLGSLLLATPVYNEFRYAYGLFVALPLMLSEAFGKESLATVSAYDV